MSEFAVTAVTTLGLVALAEVGDKTQLVCMALAARHRALPVWLGAVSAFAALNLLAVLFGAAIALRVPEWILSAVVALLFALFGVQALTAAGEEQAEVEERAGRSILLSTLLLIFVAEFGDKTQLVVAGLACTHHPAPVWLGATVALALTTAAGVLAGRTLLQRLPRKWLHRLTGALFLILAALAGWRAAALNPYI